MGGKGGGGGDYYAQPADTSGYGTPEEAKISLAKEAPLDMSKYQQTINVQKAAHDATAPDPIPSGITPPPSSDTTGDKIADTIKPPDYWTNGGLKPKAANKSSMTTTQT
jgi:hypothetical protein